MPRLLDLFCGAGGASVGYAQAGFDVVGVDLLPQPHYPYEFHRADALAYPLDGFDVVHASPPCQRFTRTGAGRRIGAGHPDLLTPTRERLVASGLLWCIENVPGAPMPNSFVLCGRSFGLPIIRHRQFETNPDFLLVPSPTCRRINRNSVTGHGPGISAYASSSWRKAWRSNVIPVVWPWMSLSEAGQAIPPAYTEWIGRQLILAIAAGGEHDHS